MQALSCLKTRRSIRKFKNTPVSQEIIDNIIDCARRAPSAHNYQPWAFIVVRDQLKKEKLSQIQPWASFVAEAPVCIALCMTDAGVDFSPSNYLSVACAGENILLATHAQGLASCWVYVKDFNKSAVEKKAKDILAVPENVELIGLFPIGYPDQEIKSRNLKDKSEIMRDEQW
jgi:nitroreductase